MTSAKTVEQGNKPHYAWLVMIAYGLMMSGTIGSFSVVGAQWFYPVSTDIGCELSTLTLYTTIEMVCMGLAMPLVGNLLTRVKLPVILIAAVAMEVLATVAMAFYDEPWMWYVSGVFVGLGLAATSTVTVTPTMGNWFAKKTGFAIGVVWAIQALYCAWMALCSPPLSRPLAGAPHISCSPRHPHAWRCLPSSSLSAIALKIRGFCLTGTRKRLGALKPWLPAPRPACRQPQRSAACRSSSAWAW